MGDVADRERELGRLRRRLSAAARRGDAAEVEALKVLYAALKGELVEREHREQREVARARRAAGRAVERPRPERWRLPFTRSPGAQERDRQPVPVEPVRGPVVGLSPWRRGGHPMAERIWRPGG